MKIAVVGTGIAGLTAAWLFSQANHHVVLYERSATVGMGSQTVRLEVDGIMGQVDVPLRGFNPENWPNYIGLCRALQIDIEPLDISHSFNWLNGKSLLAYHNVEVEQPYHALLQMKQLLQPTTRQILNDLLKFKKTAKADMADPVLAQLDLKDYLITKPYTSAFVYGCLYPALGTICTCSYAMLDSYPVYLIIDFLEHMLGTMGLYRVTGGTQAIIKALTQTIPDIRYNNTVTAIEQTDSAVILQTECDPTARYDHVLIATQANHAWSLLSRPNPLEIETLQAFPYDPVEVIVHTDRRFMPVDETQWGMLNFFAATDYQAAMSTIWMNRVETAWHTASPIYQTVMPLFEPDPATLVHRSYFERAVVTHQSNQALHTLAELHQQPDRRVWFTGSYAVPGIPLLESGVKASATIAERLGIACPWE